MNRGASAAVQAEWAKPANAPAHLLEVRFDAGDGGSIYLTDSYRSVAWGGNTYLGVGQLLGFGGLRETLSLSVTDLTVGLSGVDQSFIAVFLQRKFIDRQLFIHQAFFDGADVLIVDPVNIHQGRMDAPRIVEDPDAGKCVVEVASRCQFSNFEQTSGRHTNPHEQNLLFPMDRGFDKLAALNSTPFVWGHVKEPPATGFGAAMTRFHYNATWEGRLFPGMTDGLA